MLSTGIIYVFVALWRDATNTTFLFFKYDFFTYILLKSKSTLFILLKMASGALTIEQWIKKNDLPDVLKDVLYEENIENMGSLTCISMKKFDTICKGLEQKMHHLFTQDKRQHFSNCVREICPKINAMMSGGIPMNHRQQSQQPQLNRRSFGSSQNNEVMDMFRTYRISYENSVEWLRRKQQRMLQKIIALQITIVICCE